MTWLQAHIFQFHYNVFRAVDRSFLYSFSSSYKLKCIIIESEGLWSIGHEGNKLKIVQHLFFQQHLKMTLASPDKQSTSNNDDKPEHPPTQSTGQHEFDKNFP